MKRIENDEEKGYPRVTRVARNSAHARNVRDLVEKIKKTGPIDKDLESLAGM